MLNRVFKCGFKVTLSHIVMVLIAIKY